MEYFDRYNILMPWGGFDKKVFLDKNNFDVESDEKRDTSASGP